MNKSVLGLLFFILVLHFFTAEANLKTCTDRNISSVFDKVRNQDDLGWCFAQAAADMLHFYYKKHLNNKSISASHIALYYARLYNDSSSDGLTILKGAGSTQEAIKMMNLMGYSCPREIDDMLFSGLVDLSDKKKLKVLLELKKLKDSKDILGFSKLLTELREKKSVLVYLTDADVQSIFDLHFFSIPNTITGMLCQGREFHFPFKLDARESLYVDEKYHRQGIKTPIEILHQKLDQHEPIVLNYESSLISDQKSETHASVVVGRKIINGSCHLLIRNSWGESGSFYKKGIAQSKGYFWLNEKDLIKSKDFSVTYIKTN